ncbi:MAG: hypothetical protein ABF876_03120 [Acetobacter aceti]|uniref:glucosamine inositolphosphorylceramide transferase family protein n=1 Tax=Acetobacter aceti TaxID=435 RepID=UPI0011EA5B29|nr:hypothetical protein [Acetobacter aceti]
MNIFRTDIWKSGVITAPVEHIVAAGSIDPFPIHLLPAHGSFCSLSDPFGMWYKGDLYVVAQYYDYRTRKGVIKALRLNGMFQIMEERVVLSEPWLLSYPVLIEADGEIWMLPQACGSTKPALYRAIDFPWHWEPVPEFSFPWPAINATPANIDGQWWMFYTSPEPDSGALRIAHAKHFFGPWQNIVSQLGKGGYLLAGSPLAQDGRVILPTRNCTNTCDDEIQFIKAALPLSPSSIFKPDVTLKTPARLAPFTQGLHTLSAAGGVTFIDIKHIATNWPRRLIVDIGYKLGML